MKPKTATLFTNRTIEGIGWHTKQKDGVDTKIRITAYKEKTHIGIFGCELNEKSRVVALPMLLRVYAHHNGANGVYIPDVEGETKATSYLSELLQKFWPSNESLVAAYRLFHKLEEVLPGYLGEQRSIVFEPEEENIPAS